MAALFESARVHFNRALTLDGWARHRWLVARVEINYLAEGYCPDPVEIAAGSARSAIAAGTSSPRRSKSACIATCDAVLVMSASGGRTSLPEDSRAGLEANQLRL